MPRTFTTIVGLDKYLESACQIAVKNTADILCAKLREFINEDYYKAYAPMYYRRTEKFLNSAVAQMIGKTSASIGISDAFMGYQYPATYGNPDGSKGHWTGEDQAQMAAVGYHGNYNIHTNKYYFEDFLDYCEKNAVPLLRQELKKQGLVTI